VKYTAVKYFTIFGAPVKSLPPTDDSHESVSISLPHPLPDLAVAYQMHASKLIVAAAQKQSDSIYQPLTVM
jgi:hypothetical protein